MVVREVRWAMSEGLIYRQVDAEMREILQSIPTHTPGGVFIVEPGTDRILYVGANMLKMLGYTEEQFRERIGDEFEKLVFPADLERVMRSIREQEKRSASVRTMYRIRRGDDSLMWVVAESRSRVLENGKTIAYVAILDVTGTDLVKRGLQESFAGPAAKPAAASVAASDRALSESGSNTAAAAGGANMIAAGGADTADPAFPEMNYILESIMAGVVVYRFQSDGFHIVLEEANEYCVQIVDCSRDELIGLDEVQLFQMIDPEDHEMVRTFFSQLCTGNGHRDSITYRLLSAKGSRYYLCQCSSNRQPDGTYRVFCVYTDTSHQMALEAEFNVILHNFLFANPDSRNTFRLNLTKDLCCECYGTAAVSREREGFYTAQETLDALGRIIGNVPVRETFTEKYTVAGLLKMHQEGQHPSIEYKRVVAGERKRWVRTYFYLLQNPASEDVEAIGYTVDVDHLHKEEQIISIIAAREYDSYGVIDIETGAVEYFSHNPDNIDGIDEDAVEKPEDGVEAVLAHMETEEEREEFRRNMEFSYILSRLEQDGVYSYAYSFAGMRKQMTYHYLDEDKEELVFAAKDVTEAFRLEEENAGILRHALENEQRANSQKTSFFGNASHDLRTPLNAIIGYDELVLERDDLPEGVRDYLIKIRTAGQNMLNLVNDMLDLQRIESGQTKLKPEVTDSRVMVEEILAIVQPQAEAKELEMVIDVERGYGGEIWTDPIRTRQAYVNLLSNAIKFTPEGGTVRFTIICDGIDGNVVHDRIVVEDTGIGMSEDFVQNRLFEPFAQERTKATAYIGGTGLGMSIVKKTVEMLGGRIEVESRLGVGTRYTLYLDFQKAEGHENSEKKAAGRSARRSIGGMKLLLCEDNAMNSEIATEVLTLAGAQVDAACDGQEGSSKFIESAPGTYDAILMDIRMPVMNGYDAAERIRASAHPQAKTIPIIALSADAFESDIKRARAAGMNGHLPKPLNVEELIAELSKYRIVE